MLVSILVLMAAKGDSELSLDFKSFNEENVFHLILGIFSLLSPLECTSWHHSNIFTDSSNLTDLFLNSRTSGLSNFFLPNVLLKLVSRKIIRSQSLRCVSEDSEQLWYLTLLIPTHREIFTYSDNDNNICPVHPPHSQKYNCRIGCRTSQCYMISNLCLCLAWIEVFASYLPD